MVIAACRKHLRGVCGHALDSLQGPSHEVCLCQTPNQVCLLPWSTPHQILINDCIVVLERFAEAGRKFDYVVNDLTAVPVVTQDREGAHVAAQRDVPRSNPSPSPPAASDWDFLKLVLDLSFEVLGEQGRYFTQGNSFNMAESLALYERFLQALPYHVTCTKVSLWWMLDDDLICNAPFYSSI
jgi:spermine synthase